MKGLSGFMSFDYERFLGGKTFTHVKVAPWIEDGKDLGGKVTVQIVEDKTKYAQEGVDNFGELVVVKVRNAAPNTFSKWVPLETEVSITNVERAVVYGEYRNQLSIIAVVTPKGTH